MFEISDLILSECQSLTCQADSALLLAEYISGHTAVGGEVGSGHSEDLQLHFGQSVGHPDLYLQTTSWRGITVSR